MTRDEFRARVSDLLRRSEVEDAEDLIALMDSFVPSSDLIDALIETFRVAQEEEKAPFGFDSINPVYLQVVTKGKAIKYSVGQIYNTLHGRMFRAHKVYGADI